MKKILLGIAIGAIVVIPGSALAWQSYANEAKPIYGVDCDNDGNCKSSVYVFDDGGNKCYVASGVLNSGYTNPNLAISCIKEN